MDKEKFDKTPLLPIELKLRTLHSYIRDANRVLNVKVYEIRYWKNTAQPNAIQNNGTPVKKQNADIIYFCQ